MAAEKDLTADTSAAAIARLRLNELVGNMFQLVRSVHGACRTSQGSIDPDSMFTIGEFQDSKGATVYVRRASTGKYPSQDQIAKLSTRIQTEQTGFNGLDPSEKKRIQKEGSPQFKAYLDQEALRAEFQRLE